MEPTALDGLVSSLLDWSDDAGKAEFAQDVNEEVAAAAYWQSEESEARPRTDLDRPGPDL